MNGEASYFYFLLTALITLGGDHSIALPLLRAHAKKYGPVGLVHVDAHIDTWEAEFEAIPYSHGTPFRHALNEGLVREGEYVQIGIRGPLSGANDYADAACDDATTVQDLHVWREIKWGRFEQGKPRNNPRRPCPERIR